MWIILVTLKLRQPIKYNRRLNKETDPLESKTNYTIIGAAVLLLATALLASLLWLSVGFDSKKYNTYVVYIHESINGLTEDSVVKFNGVKVGSVKSITLSEKDPQSVKLLLKIEDEVLITTSTRATLITQGITGVTFLGLTATSPERIPLKAIGKKKFPVIPYKASFFNQMEDNLTKMSNSLKRVFDKENAKRFKKTLESLEKTTAMIAKNNENISKSLNELPVVIQNISIAANHISGAMSAGKNGFDQITQQTIAPANVLLKRLDIIAANLEQVSALMRQNPAVIIRGTSIQPSGPGE